MTYSITLEDGRKINDLKVNGTNFISQTKIDESIFIGNLETMTVSNKEITETYHNIELVQQVQYSDGWYLAFRELSPQELKEIEIDKNLKQEREINAQLMREIALLKAGV